VEVLTLSETGYVSAGVYPQTAALFPPLSCQT
jgi:hypothetical protein